jgi:predicted RNase H-like HicB family nuclease
MDLQARMELVVPSTVRKKGKWYVSSCSLLDVHSEGRTEPEARRNLVEAFVEFLLSCFERGTLNEVLREAGFVPVAEARSRPTAFPKKGQFVRVPLPFVIAQRTAIHSVQHT